MSTLKKARHFGLLGIALCSLCCVLPVIGTVIGVTSLTAIAFYPDKIGFALIGLSIFLFAYSRYTKRRKLKVACSNSCDVSCECRAEGAVFS